MLSSIFKPGGDFLMIDRLMVVLSLFIAITVYGEFPGESVPRGQSNAVQASSSPTVHSPAAVGAKASAEVAKKITAYTLPPGVLAKAKSLARIRFAFRVFSIFYGLWMLWFILRRKYSAKFRDWAEAASHRRFLQAAIYVPLLAIAISLLSLPLDLFNHALFKRYGISIQSWGSWTGDWLKVLMLTIVGGTLMALLLYTIIRRSPQRWWLYFWILAMPILTFIFFLQPYVIDPMFNEFQPLSAKAPALVPALQRIARRAGMEIPAERMFWMKASDKEIFCNAYVTGFGASKRIVIWDTCFTTDTTDGILTTFGHELGHYALGHVWKGLVFFSLLAFVLLFLGWRSIGWLLRKFGERWGIRDVGDWGSLPALLLLLSVFGFFANVAGNTFSRYDENQADVYGLEVTHGIVADPGQAVAISFQKFGESVFVDPDPNPVYVFLFFDHPTVSERVRLAASYDPWSKSESPQFLK
jgi:Zn-dependent protease with chaperone function